MDVKAINEFDITKHDIAVDDFSVIDNQYELHYIEHGDYELKDWQECVFSVKKGQSISKEFEKIQNYRHDSFFLRVVIYHVANNINEFIW